MTSPAFTVADDKGLAELGDGEAIWESGKSGGEKWESTN